MKTFSIALILGIFIGAMITAYYHSPESFESLFSSSGEKDKSQSEDKGLAAPGAIVDKAKETAGDIAEKSTDVAQNVKEGAEKIAEKASETSVEVAAKTEEIVDSAKDASIKTSITGKLKLDSSIDSSRITVEVKNGSVILKGEVSSRAEERKARDIALDTRFVKDVQSQLAIVP